MALQRVTNITKYTSMIAVVEIAGKQYKVSPKSQVLVDLLEGNVGDEVNVDMVLLKSGEKGEDCTIGQPYTGDKISAKIVEHVKGEKIRVFKTKPKTRYAKTKGHRQSYTVLEMGEF